MESNFHANTVTKLPDMAAYGAGISGTVKRKTIINVPPIQGSVFSPTGQRIINIQLPRNGFLNGLNSYLVFNHQSPATASSAMTGSLVNAADYVSSSEATREVRNALSESGSSWIQRLRIKVGPNIVEDIDDYNVLHAIMQNVMVSQQYKNSAAGQMEGYQASWIKQQLEIVTPLTRGQTGGTEPVVVSWNGASLVLGQAVTNDLIGTTRSALRHLVSGIKVNLNRRGVPNTNTGDNCLPYDQVGTLQRWAAVGKQYQVRLLSGLLDSKKYLPLRFMAPVEIEITLCDFARSHTFECGTGSNKILPGFQEIGDPSGVEYYIPPMTADARLPTGSTVANPIAIPAVDSRDMTYAIWGVSYMAEMLEFDESFYNSFAVSLNNGITVPYTSFTNHAFAHTGSSADIQIAERVRSAKAIFAVQRRNADLAHGRYSKFAFVQNGLSQYQVKIGTQYFPLQPIDLYGGSGNAQSDPYSGVRLIELQKTVSSISDRVTAHGIEANDSYQGFVIGVDLDREYNRLSGLDTTRGLPLFLSLKHKAASEVDGGQPCALNVFVHYDMFLDLLPADESAVLN
jgi:hypothetical protein